MSENLSAPLVEPAGTAVDEPGRPSTLLTRSLRLWRTRIGLALVLLLVSVALFGRFLAPHSPYEFVAIPHSPRGTNGAMFGTDYLGQDVLSRFLYGGLVVLGMALLATAIGLLLGITIGLVAAFSRNRWDSVLMRAVDVILAFPFIMLALVAVTLAGPKASVIIGAIALSTTPQIARVARGAAQPVVEQDFVAAAEAVGMSRLRILSGELLPNIMGPMLVETSLRLGWSIAGIAALAFLGLAPNPNSPNWGTMIQQNQLALSSQPWGVLLPVLAIALLTAGSGLLSDGIARTAAGIDRERDA